MKLRRVKTFSWNSLTMARVFDRSRSSSFNFRRMFDRQPSDSRTSMDAQHIGSPLVSIPSNKVASVSRKESSGASNVTRKSPTEIDLLKERFAKLLLGEDMSGGGKGVSSSLALSNAITNLAASVFGEIKKLEPMPSDKKAKWRKEVNWLLSVTDHIVELVPSQQQAADGSTMEIMVTKQRSDLLVNIPALKKLDAMLTDCLDNFQGQTEFTYVSSADANEAEKAASRDNDKWWIPTVKILPGGLSDATKKWIQQQKDAVNQVLKAAMAINAQVLSEMGIPESYIESLPKNGRASLGDLIYKSITDEFFDPDSLLTNMDLTSEHKVLDLKNRIEASIVIWKRKIVQKDGKSSWSSAVSMEKRELFEERAETMLLVLKHQYPGLPQSTLEISKIQYNNDVGHAVLESYSRVLESLASAILNRIDDVIYADYVAVKAAGSEAENSPGTPTSTTLSDLMSWSMEDGAKKISDDFDKYSKELDSEKIMPKSPLENKRISYLERLEHLGGIRSPTARH